VNIKILGPGCARCHQLGQTTKEVVKELGLDASIEEVKDIKKMLDSSSSTPWKRKKSPSNNCDLTGQAEQRGDCAVRAKARYRALLRKGISSRNISYLK